MSSDERRGRGREEDDRAGDVGWLTDAMETGDALENIGLELRVVKRGSRSRRFDEGRRHGVYRDAVLPPLDGQALRQVGDGRLGHAVHRLARQRDVSRLRTDIDDAAASLTD